MNAAGLNTHSASRCSALIAHQVPGEVIVVAIAGLDRRATSPGDLRRGGEPTDQGCAQPNGRRQRDRQIPQGLTKQAGRTCVLSGNAERPPPK